MNQRELIELQKIKNKALVIFAIMFLMCIVSVSLLIKVNLYYQNYEKTHQCVPNGFLGPFIPTDDKNVIYVFSPEESKQIKAGYWNYLVQKSKGGAK